MILSADQINAAINDYNATFNKGKIGYIKPDSNYPGVVAGKTPDELSWTDRNEFISYLHYIGIDYNDIKDKPLFKTGLTNKNRPYKSVNIWPDKMIISYGGFYMPDIQIKPDDKVPEVINTELISMVNDLSDTLSYCSRSVFAIMANLTSTGKNDKCSDILLHDIIGDINLSLKHIETLINHFKESEDEFE